MRSVPQEALAEGGPDSGLLLLGAGETDMSQAWPSLGHVVIKNLEVRYQPHLMPAVKDLTLDVPGGEHLGIVGRTGSGKSSLLLALARLVEPSAGCVRIDGVDIGRIGLQELRPHLGVLSQDPLFFSGSLRENLDPFAEHSDEVLWSALKDVGLSELFSVSGLGAAIGELGGNLSTGERQLLCLTCAALREPRLVLVDEATAALNAAADARVQAVLDARFGMRGATLLQVAHRLWSVARCHRVAVLEKGALVEVGPPSELLALGPEGAHFRAMVEGLGAEEAQAFRQALIGHTSF